MWNISFCFEAIMANQNNNMCAKRSRLAANWKTVRKCSMTSTEVNISVINHKSHKKHNKALCREFSPVEMFIYRVPQFWSSIVIVRISSGQFFFYPLTLLIWHPEAKKWMYCEFKILLYNHLLTIAALLLAYGQCL